MGVDPRYAARELSYFQDPFNPVYPLTSTDLEDDRWVVRVWHADRWFRALERSFRAREIGDARPDLWASDDPSATVPGEKEPGNAGLSRYLCDGCFADGQPRRYAEVRRLNDGLRERMRDALVAYLCAMGRVPLPWSTGATAAGPRDLSDLLLIDVEAGVGEAASRVEEAVSAVQAFIRRSRLGLEPAWKVAGSFARLWDGCFESYRTWERCKRRELYRENWIEWAELARARRIEAFRFLESQLRSSTLTAAVPGGLDWWPDADEPLDREPEPIQWRRPSEIDPLSPSPSLYPSSPTSTPTPTTREGLDVLGRPDAAGQPAWLAAVPQPSLAGSASATATSTSKALMSPTPAPTPTSATAKAPAPTIARTLVQAAASGDAQPLPLWMEAAMKLGTRFSRVAAAGKPPAATRFVPRGKGAGNGCCPECGHDHPALVDEFYFWLVRTWQYDAPDDSQDSFQSTSQFGYQDPYYDPYQQQSTQWDDETQVAQLVAKWQPNPAVRLAWCRVHHGRFGQPSISDDCVEIDGDPDLVLLGRSGDSLYFHVTGTPVVPPPGDGSDNSLPGFRCDLPSDRAVAVPQVIPTPSPTSTPIQLPTYPGQLPAYPFFIYDDPGERLFPGSWFSIATVVADALRPHCRFELGLRWYRRVFDPLRRDCRWMICGETTRGNGESTTTTTPAAASKTTPAAAGTTAPAAASKTTEATGDTTSLPAGGAATGTTNVPAAGPTPGSETRAPSGQGACCDTAKVSDDVARDRAMTLRYCETLLEWGDELMRRRRSPEAFQQARLLYDTAGKILGRRPRSVLMAEPSNPQPVVTFSPAFAPLNPRLLDIYDRLGDRLGLIHTCQDARRLRDGRPDRDMPFFGDDPLREGWRTATDRCGDGAGSCDRQSPYRFDFLIQRAKELAAGLRELGSSLLSAYEKGDAEYLAAIRAEHEREVFALGIAIRQDQWRDADWQVQALQQTKYVNQTNLIYYNNLYQNGLINDEIQNQTLATAAMQTRTSANVTEAVGEAMHIIPDFYVGAVSTFSHVPVGDKLAALFQTIAKVMQTVADIQGSTASLDLTQAGWQRREVDWFHQTQTLPIEIQQIELQILGAQRRRDQALRELNTQQRQLEQSSEVQDFLRDKFTDDDLYLWLQKETGALYFQMFELATLAARQAERAFNLERGHTTRRFIPEAIWDDLREGLLAGERLEFAVRRMEHAYCDENRREYEITKNLSLRLHFPMAYLQLRTTGYCVFEIPEWMFDLDKPGLYMRRIKSVTLTIPCTTNLESLVF